MTKEANPDPRRKLDTKGKIKTFLTVLNPGQQCAMKQADGAYWYPYILVAHNQMIDLGAKKLVPMAGMSVVKLEQYAWTVPSRSWVYLVDGTTEDLRIPTLYGPDGKPL